MSNAISTTRELPYAVNDADQHSDPAPDAYLRYIDPKLRDKAIQTITREDGQLETLYAGRPARMRAENRPDSVASLNEAPDSDASPVENQPGLAGAGLGSDGLMIPGSTLGKLNPLKDLDAEGRVEFARRYRALQAKLDSPQNRLSVMDEMGVNAIVSFAGPLGIEYEFEYDLEGLYANIRAINRYFATEWSFNYNDRLFTPAFIPMASPELALRELEQVMIDGPPSLIQISTGPSIHTSPFRPEHDPFWARINEAGIRVCTHLASKTFYARQGEEWSEPEAHLADMDAFQYLFYYCDRPAMETVAAAILQGLFVRFPNIRMLLSEQGTLWVPYLVRSMDRSSLIRRATWDKLEKRPSEYFKEHFVVTPWPEENVDRVIEVVGTDPIVFGSDFPHGNGLPDPLMYLGQLKNLSEQQVEDVMRGNLARFLGVP